MPLEVTVMIKRSLPMSAVILAAVLCLAAGASAQVPSLPLPAPPPGASAVSGTLFDAMLAIARAVSSNPSAAEAAAFPYNAAVQQYNIGDYSRAQQSALQALMQAAPPLLPQPPVISPTIPQPTIVPMPHLVSTVQADAESFVGLARRSLGTCGKTGAAPPADANQHYDDAASALLARNYLTAEAAAQATIDECALALQPAAS
jgi:hypothetical protein